MQADYLGQMRTGAASGVATQYMARPDATEVGLFGSGKQARPNCRLSAKCAAFARSQVYSPNEERRKQFAARDERGVPDGSDAGAAPGDGGGEKRHHHHGDDEPRSGALGTGSREGRTSTPIGSNFLGKAESTPPPSAAAIGRRGQQGPGPLRGRRFSAIP